jgi:hypothetical protein
MLQLVDVKKTPEQEQEEIEHRERIYKVSIRNLQEEITKL